jgi:hypothetical protein
MKVLAFGLIGMTLAACGEDAPDTSMDGGSGSHHEAPLDAGRAGAATMAKVDPLQSERDADGGFRITTPAGEVCSAAVGLGSLVIVESRTSDGKICVVVNSTLVVYDSACVRFDAGSIELNEAQQACLRMAWGLPNAVPSTP